MNKWINSENTFPTAEDYPIWVDHHTFNKVSIFYRGSKLNNFTKFMWQSADRPERPAPTIEEATDLALENAWSRYTDEKWQFYNLKKEEFVAGFNAGVNHERAESLSIIQRLGTDYEKFTKIIVRNKTIAK